VRAFMSVRRQTETAIAGVVVGQFGGNRVAQPQVAFGVPDVALAHDGGERWPGVSGFVDHLPPFHARPAHCWTGGALL